MGQGHPEKFPLPGSLLLVRNIGGAQDDPAHSAVFDWCFSTVEHAALARVAGARLSLGRGGDLVQSVDHRPSGRQAVEGPGFGQTFKGAAVQPGGTSTAAEIVDGLVGPILFAFCDYGADRSLSHRLDGGKSYPESRAGGLAFI